MKKKIVISGINLFQGGPLSIYTDLLDEIVEKKIYLIYDFKLLVHKKVLFSKYSEYFEIEEFPKSRKNWLIRIFYEYFYFYKYSNNKNIYLWISLHDISPNVHTQHLITYCHNPSFSYNMNFKDGLLDKKVFLFSKFYKYLYKININKNDFIIVQQDWMANEFKKMYKLNENSVILFPANKTIKVTDLKYNKFQEYTFFFPSLARPFKNFEVICEAVNILNRKNIRNFKVILTIDGSENKYSTLIVNKYKNLNNIEFVGLLSREEVFNYYQKTHCLIFPSKLETWGLPISEAKEFNLPIIAADLPYAHETVGNYDKVCFFNCNNANELSNLMEKVINNENIFYYSHYQIKNKYLCNSWNDIFKIIEKER